MNSVNDQRGVDAGIKYRHIRAISTQLRHAPTSSGGELQLMLLQHRDHPLRTIAVRPGHGHTPAGYDRLGTALTEPATGQSTQDRAGQTTVAAIWHDGSWATFTHTPDRITDLHADQAFSHGTIRGHLTATRCAPHDLPEPARTLLARLHTETSPRPAG